MQGLSNILILNFRKLFISLRPVRIQGSDFQHTPYR